MNKTALKKRALPKQKKGNYTQDEALDFVFQHDNESAAEIMEIPYNTFGSYRFRYEHDNLIQKTADKILISFGFDKVSGPQFKLNK